MLVGFLIGLFVGGTVGVFAMCLCRAASEADKCMDFIDSEE